MAERDNTDQGQALTEEEVAALAVLDSMADPAGVDQLVDRVVQLVDAKTGEAAVASGGATAPKKGTGAKPAKKKEKTIDFGQLNVLVEHFSLIYGTDQVYDGVNRLMMTIGAMAHAHSSDMVRMWKASEKRRTVMPTDVVFDPTETCGEECVNLFGGMELEPKKGDVQPILDLVKFLTSRASENEDECEEVMHWLMCWLAYPLQNRGAKMRTAVVVHGDEGAGKNFLFDLVIDIYGRYGALVGQDELEDKFNDWRSGKLFVVGDEVSSRAELVHNKNRLKALITSPTVQINPKNLARRTEKNHMNIVFLSNELQPLALDNSDRRYLVVYTPRAKDFSYYAALAKWKEAGGAEAFYQYLLDYPIDGFNAYAPAPMTKAKADLIDINRKSPERFWQDWHDGLIDLPYHSCSSDQAYQAYQKYAQRIGDRFPVQQNLFTRMLTRFAESQGKPVKTKSMQVTEAGSRKGHRMFLVCEIPAGVKEGAFASEAVEAFDKALRKYTAGGWSRSPVSEEDQAGRGRDD
jgi:putative DNA primase/helicase